MPASPRLTDPTFLAELEGLRLVPRLVLAGRLSGARSSPRRGFSQEFEDYRSYVPGDDLRFLDWNVYARLRKPVLKLFRAEEEVDVYLLLDLSASLAWGDPPKFHTLLKLAAALAYLVLSGGDRIGLLAHGERGETLCAPARGTGFLLPFLRRLEQLSPGGSFAPRRDLKSLLARVKQRSLLFFLSDFFFEEGVEPAIRFLAAGRHPSTAIQILHPQELDPELDGNLTLVDPESGEKREISVDAGILTRYKKLMDSWNQGLLHTCLRHGVGCVQVRAGEPLREIVMRVLSGTAWQWKGRGH